MKIPFFKVFFTIESSNSLLIVRSHKLSETQKPNNSTRHTLMQSKEIQGKFAMKIPPPYCVINKAFDNELSPPVH